MAPATPPPCRRSLFAALTMASTSISVRSPFSSTTFSAMPIHAPARRAVLPAPSSILLLLRRGIVVDAAAGFAPEPPGLHVLREQRAGAVLFTQRLVKIFEDAEAHVETDQVHGFEWAHGVVQAELQGLVNVGRAGDAGFQHMERLVADHGVNSAGDEPRRFAYHHDFLAHPPAHLAAGRQRRFGGL